VYCGDANKLEQRLQMGKARTEGKKKTRKTRKWEMKNANAMVEIGL